MSCNDYLPRFQDQINPDDPLGGLNCNTYSAGMAGDYDTCGNTVPLGKRVRELTGDTVGGTNLMQVDDVLRVHYNIDLDTRIGSSALTWDQFSAKIDAGHGAILQGSYSVIHETRFLGDSNFQGNHSVFVPPKWKVMDPLCDGRQPGLYKFHGEVYPQDLMKRFAGLLLLDERKNVRLGIGRVWCSLTRDNTSGVVIKYAVSVKPTPPATKLVFYRYLINSDGRITGREKSTTGGFPATCTPPRLYQPIPGHGYIAKSLVQLTSGSRKGWYISSAYAHEV